MELDDREERRLRRPTVAVKDVKGVDGHGGSGWSLMWMGREKLLRPRRAGRRREGKSRRVLGRLGPVGFS